MIKTIEDILLNNGYTIGIMAGTKYSNMKLISACNDTDDYNTYRDQLPESLVSIIIDLRTFKDCKCQTTLDLLKGEDVIISFDSLSNPKINNII